MNLSKEEEKLILEYSKAKKVSDLALKGIPLYKVLLFILDKYKNGGYYGTICIKINGTDIYDPYETDVKHKLDLKYNLEDQFE